MRLEPDVEGWVNGGIEESFPQRRGSSIAPYVMSTRNDGLDEMVESRQSLGSEW
ncbi:MAG: hypothetical protein M3N22_07745 [Acidobacteriota bacterium]|nr:hypothetical protein [Acidobacteriota bacterium]